MRTRGFIFEGVASFSLLVLVLIAYWRLFFNGFAYDDYLVIVNNPHIVTADLKNLLFSSDYFALSGEGSYRPVVTFVYSIVARLFGREPMAFHGVSMLFHGGTVFLVLVLCRRIGLGRWSLLAAAGFAVHPVLTEAVCSTAFLEDLLASFFVLCGILCFLKAVKKDAPGRKAVAWSAGAVAAFWLAVFSKESALSMLALVFVAMLPGLNLNVRWRRMVALYAVLAFAAAFYGWIRFFVLPGHGSEAERLGGGVLQSLWQTSGIFADYIDRLIYPATLSVRRSASLPGDPAAANLWLSAAVHVFLFGSAVFAWRRVPVYSFGILWFYIALSPTSNIVPLFVPAADRYLYLPAVGFLIALAGLTRQVYSSKIMLSRMIVLPVILLCAAWLARTIDRVPDWRNNRTLWSYELNIDPGNAEALTELAVYSNSKGWHDRAEAYARKALSREGAGVMARLELGKALLRQGRLKQAIEAHEQVLSNRKLPKRVLCSALMDMAYVYERKGRKEDAAELYRKILNVAPYSGLSVRVSIRLGMFYAESGDHNAALDVWRLGLKKAPGNEILKHNIDIAERRISWGKGRND